MAPDIPGDPPLDAVVVEPQGPPTGCVIWLHGLGADGWDFEPVVRGLDLAARGIRAILPHAPQRPVTINGGMRMRAWYDIATPDLTRDEDAAGIQASAAAVTRLLERERANGIPPERLVLAGFSQGGAIALEAGLRHAEPLAGLVILSAYLPLGGAAAAQASPAGRGARVFLGHGSEDPVVAHDLGLQVAATLGGLGCEVEQHTYPIAHGVSPVEIQDLDRWLRRTLD